MNDYEKLMFVKRRLKQILTENLKEQISKYRADGFYRDLNRLLLEIDAIESCSGVQHEKLNKDKKYKINDKFYNHETCEIFIITCKGKTGWLANVEDNKMIGNQVKIKEYDEIYLGDLEAMYEHMYELSFINEVKK